MGVLENFSFLFLFPVWAQSILMLSDRDPNYGEAVV